MKFADYAKIATGIILPAFLLNCAIQGKISKIPENDYDERDVNSLDDQSVDVMPDKILYDSETDKYKANGYIVYGVGPDELENMEIFYLLGDAYTDDFSFNNDEWEENNTVILTPTNPDTNTLTFDHLVSFLNENGIEHFKYIKLCKFDKNTGKFVISVADYLINEEGEYRRLIIQIDSGQTSNRVLDDVWDIVKMLIYSKEMSQEQ